MKPQGRAKDHAVRKGVKAFSDALLDLLVDTEETRRHVKDLWGKQELLYLGPDEQVWLGLYAIEPNDSKLRR